MRFSGYTSDVQVRAEAPHVTAAGNPLAYGAGGAGWQAAGRAVGQVAAYVDKRQQEKQQEEDTQSLLEARNRIMTSLTDQMYNGENGLMTTGFGENAKGLADRVTNAVRSTTDEVLKDYNGNVQKAVRKHLSENIANYQRIAASRESSEAVKLKGVRYEDAMKSGVQLCGLNYNNDDVIRTQLQDGVRLASAMGKDMGLPGEQVAAKQRGVYTDCISSAVSSALNAEDFARARKLLDENKKDMDIIAWNKLDKIVADKQEKIDTYNTAKNIYEETGGDIFGAREMAEKACTNKNGTFDIDKFDKMMARINSLAAQDRRAEKAVRQAAGRRAAAEVSQLISAEEVEDYKQEHKEELGEDGMYWIDVEVGLRNKRAAALNRGYKDKNLQADSDKVDSIILDLQNGKNVSSSKWINARRAGERLSENGGLSEEEEEALNAYGADKELNSYLTDIISVKGLSGGYNALVDAGMPKKAAGIMALRSDPRYMTGNLDWNEDDSEESEEEE